VSKGFEKGFDNWRDDSVEQTNLLAKIPWVGNFWNIRQHEKPADCDGERDNTVDHEKPDESGQGIFLLYGKGTPVLPTIATL
jgi:hypothetical protein